MKLKIPQKANTNTTRSSDDGDQLSGKSFVNESLKYGKKHTFFFKFLKHYFKRYMNFIIVLNFKTFYRVIYKYLDILNLT